MDESVEAGSSLPDNPLDIKQILREALRRWFRPDEICKIIQNHEKFGITSEPPDKPQSGSFFLFDRNVQKRFGNDGHNWKKEGHRKLKAGSADNLNCYYARGRENEKFQRRRCWILEGAFSHIAFVHYREITGRMEDFSCVKKTEGEIPHSQVTEKIVPNFEIDSSSSSGSRPNICLEPSENTDRYLDGAQPLERENAQPAIPGTDLAPTQSDEGKSDNHAEAPVYSLASIEVELLKDDSDQSFSSFLHPNTVDEFLSADFVKMLDLEQSQIPAESKGKSEDTDRVKEAQVACPYSQGQESDEIDVSSIPSEGKLDIQDINAAENYSDRAETNLLLRFDKILCSGSSATNPVTSSSEDASQLSSKISSLLQGDNKELDQMLKTGSGTAPVRISSIKDLSVTSFGLPPRTRTRRDLDVCEELEPNLSNSQLLSNGSSMTSNRSSGTNKQGNNESTIRIGSIAKEGESPNENVCIEQDAPGVYLSFTALPGGGNDIKRVPFSRKRFSVKQAVQWCAVRVIGKSGVGDSMEGYEGWSDLDGVDNYPDDEWPEDEGPEKDQGPEKEKEGGKKRAPDSALEGGKANKILKAYLAYKALLTAYYNFQSKVEIKMRGSVFVDALKKIGRRGETRGRGTERRGAGRQAAGEEERRGKETSTRPCFGEWKGMLKGIFSIHGSVDRKLQCSKHGNNSNAAVVASKKTGGRKLSYIDDGFEPSTIRV